MNCPRCGAIEKSAVCRSCGLADEAERGYDVDQITPLITCEWLDHAQVWEVLARPAASEPWTRLEGFDREPLMKRAREIAYPS